MLKLSSMNFLAVTIVPGLVFGAIGGATATAGIWSQDSTLLSFTVGSPDIPGTRRIDVLAPDHQKIAKVNDVHIQVVVDGKSLLGTENEGVGPLAELAWAPDSTVFFITESDGGIIGTWDTWVYWIEDGKVHRKSVTQEVTKRFKQHYKCMEPEEANVGGVKWWNGSKTLLLVAEVPPHSSCPEMGKVRGYMVLIPSGEIVEEWDEKRLMADWGQYLGERFARRKGN